MQKGRHKFTTTAGIVCALSSSSRGVIEHVGVPTSTVLYLQDLACIMFLRGSWLELELQGC